MLTALNVLARGGLPLKALERTGHDRQADTFVPGSGEVILPGLRALALAAGLGATPPTGCPIQQRVTAVLAQTLELPADQLPASASLFDDLGGDSIDWFEFVTGLEAEFQVRISEEDAGRIRSIADAVSHLKSRGGLR